MYTAQFASVRVAAGRMRMPVEKENKGIDKRTDAKEKMMNDSISEFCNFKSEFLMFSSGLILNSTSSH